MRVLSTPGLCCPDCASNIDKALEDAGVDHKVDLESKTVSVCDCDHCMETAIEILSDLGLDAERIS